jgi:hypothetical protein
MGYIEKILGDNELVLYRTHQHMIVLLLRILASFFAFLVFLALGLTVLLPAADEQGNQIRFIVGLIALGSLVMPIYLIVSAWLQGLRGREFMTRIWRAMLAGLLILAVSLIMMIQPDLRIIGWIAFVIAVVPAVEVVRIFLDWLNERYIITNRRVVEVKGTINKHVRDSALEKVNDVDMKQSIVGRILGYGTLQIITGSDVGINMLYRIANPVRFKRTMLNAKEALSGVPSPAKTEETTERVAPAQASQPVASESSQPSESSITDLIVELAELRQKGLISEEEFQTKKKELLDRL